MNRALFYLAPQQVELRLVPGDADPPRPLGPDQVRVRALWSAISRGTERLVFHGRVPPSEFERMKAPFQSGDFPFPVKYGYAAVGVVEAGPPALIGRSVFALHPHQQRFTIPSGAAVPTPEATPARRATLAANMETALNGVWDAGVGPGDRVAIVGAGVLGGLVAGVCAEIPGVAATLIDIAPARADLAAAMGAAFATPQEAPRAAGGADVVIHTSASASGLETALNLAGLEARVVELSWYGDAAPRAPLGGAFHSQRLRLISSQVGRLPPERAPRWSHRRRLETALALLADPKYDALITDEVAFESLPEAAPRIFADPTPDGGPHGLATVVRYGPGEEQGPSPASPAPA